MSNILLPSANKVCEGYVFTSVCHFVHGGVSRSIPSGTLGGLAGGSPGPYPGGTLRGLPGVVHGPIQREGVGESGWGSPGPCGGLVSQHELRQTPPPADSYCCGRCASYWNAFLLVWSVKSHLIRGKEYFSIFKQILHKGRRIE